MSQSVSWPLEFKVTLKETKLKNKNPEKPQWIFIHPENKGAPNQLHKLPPELPVTWRGKGKRDKGILVTCVDGRKNTGEQDNSVVGAFHRYDGRDGFKYARFYVGSAGATNRNYAPKWQAFVKRFGVPRQGNPKVDLQLLILKDEPHAFGFVERTLAVQEVLKDPSYPKQDKRYIFKFVEL
jgi:hypothetical protein